MRSRFPRKMIAAVPLAMLMSLPARAAPAMPPAGPSAVSSVPAFDPLRPETWRASAKLARGEAAREALIAAFMEKPANDWEQALTREEAEALLDDPRAELIYGDKTISIVAPSMLKRQNKGHVDLLQRFLAPERVDAGEKFAREHLALLADMEKKHGVDKEVIVSILMWESRLGTITGDFFAFNSFVSQAFFVDEANEVALARKEEKDSLSDEKQRARVERIRTRAMRNLAVLVRSSKARGIDPLGVKGSWAGALGFPQFMPASLRWAEDGDGDGKIDLFTFPDSIASIANYLKEHGWRESRESHEKAVFGYNNEPAYVSGVLAFADALKARLESPAPKRAKSTSAQGKKKSGAKSASKKGASDSVSKASSRGAPAAKVPRPDAAGEKNEAPSPSGSAAPSAEESRAAR